MFRATRRARARAASATRTATARLGGSGRSCELNIRLAIERCQTRLMTPAAALGVALYLQQPAAFDRPLRSRHSERHHASFRAARHEFRDATARAPGRRRSTVWQRRLPLASDQSAQLPGHEARRSVGRGRPPAPPVLCGDRTRAATCRPRMSSASSPIPDHGRLHPAMSTTGTRWSDRQSRRRFLSAMASRSASASRM